VGDKLSIDLKKKASERTIRDNVTATATRGYIYTAAGTFSAKMQCASRMNYPAFSTTACTINCSPSVAVGTSMLIPKGSSFSCTYACAWRNTVPAGVGIAGSTTAVALFGNSDPVAWSIPFNASNFQTHDIIDRCVDPKLYMPLINTTNKLTPLAFDEEGDLMCYTPAAPSCSVGVNAVNPNTQVKTLQSTRMFTKTSCINYSATQSKCAKCTTEEVAPDTDAIWSTTANIVNPNTDTVLASYEQSVVVLNCPKVCSKSYYLKGNGKCCKCKATQG